MASAGVCVLVIYVVTVLLVASDDDVLNASDEVVNGSSEVDTMSVGEGQNITFRCDCDGAVQWRYNVDLIYTMGHPPFNSKFSVLIVGKSHYLILHDTSPDDDGTYLCCGADDGSILKRYELRYQLRIKGNFEHINFLFIVLYAKL